MCCCFFRVLQHPLWPHLPVQLPFHFSASLYTNSHQKSSCQSFSLYALLNIFQSCVSEPLTASKWIFSKSLVTCMQLNWMINSWLILLDSWAVLTECGSISLEMLGSRIPYSPGFPHLFFGKTNKQKNPKKQKATACFQCSLLVLPHFLNLLVDFPGHRPCSSAFCTIYTHSLNVLIQFHGLYNIYMLMTPTSSYIQLRSHF